MANLPTPKPSKRWFTGEEYAFIIVLIILVGAFYIPHILDPNFYTIKWIIAIINGGPLPSINPQINQLTIPQALRDCLIVFERLSLAFWLILGIYLIWRFFWRQQQRKSMKTYRINLSRDDLATPLMVGALFDSLSKTLSKRYIRFLTGNNLMNLAFYRNPEGELIIILRSPEHYVSNIISTIQDTWTSIRVDTFDKPFIFPKDPIVAVVRPTKRTDLFAFRAYRDYTHSVVEGLLQQMDNFKDTAVIDFALKPLPVSYSEKVTKIQRRFQRELNALSSMDHADPTLSMGDQAQLQGVIKQAGRSWWRVDIRIVTADLNDLQSMYGALSSSDAENNWQYHRVWVRKKWILSLIQSGMPGFQPLAKRFFLNATHLSTIWQLPTARLRVKGLTRISVRRGPGTVGLSRSNDGCTPVEDEQGEITLPEGDRKQGIITVGQQGTGKTTILQQVAYNDMRQDKALILIDPKFRMANDLRGLIPDGKKVAIWQVGNEDITWGWNPFMQRGIDNDLIVAGVLDGMKQVWGKDGIGPRSTDYLRYAMAATLATNQGSRGFIAVEEILRNPNLWAGYGNRLPEPLSSWFTASANKYEENAKLVTEGTDPPLNKLSALNFSHKMRHSLSTSRSLDIGRVIRDKGILIVSLEADRIGNEAANLIGTFLVAAIWEALKRAGVLEPATTSIILDEAHRMVCQAFANMLAEGRSYGAQTSVGLQFLGQIPDDIVKASIDELLQNMFLFRSNQVEETENYIKLFSRVYSNLISPDAEAQDKLAFGPDDRFNLPNYNALCRVIVGGNPKPAFLGKTIPLTPSPEVADRHPWGECPEEWLITNDIKKEEKEPIVINTNKEEEVDDSTKITEQMIKANTSTAKSVQTKVKKASKRQESTLDKELSKNEDVKEDPMEVEAVNSSESNPLANLGIKDDQIETLRVEFGELILELAITQTKKKSAKESVVDPYAYLSRSCKAIKKKQDKKEEKG